MKKVLNSSRKPRNLLSIKDLEFCIHIELAKALISSSLLFNHHVQKGQSILFLIFHSTEVLYNILEVSLTKKVKLLYLHKIFVLLVRT